MKAFLSLIVILTSLLSNSHDITTLSDWGPYSKRYSGISHIGNIESGSRVDFTLIPGIYRRNVLVPDVLFESGCYPWMVNPEMTDITYRYELEWKDRLYVDATYHILDGNRVLLEMHCVNNTPEVQNVTFQTAANLQFEDEYPCVELAGTGSCVSGVDYDIYEPAVRKHDYSLVYNGWMRGEQADRKSLSGKVLETSGLAGDVVTYSVSANHPVQMRCRACGDRDAVISVNGETVTVAPSDDYVMVPVSVDNGLIRIETFDGGKLRIDSFVSGTDMEVYDRKPGYVPELSKGENDYMVKYQCMDSFYGVAWNYPYSQVREFENSDLDVFMKKAVHNHVSEYFKGDGEGHYTASFLRPVVVKAQSDTTMYQLLVCGGKDYVEQNLKSFHDNEKAFSSLIDSKGNADSDLLPGAEKYALVEQIMQATLLTNVVYPVYTQRQNIRHFTPGKNWNSLYTWDLGFIGWAMTEVDPLKAFETVRAYTTEDGSQSAFIHHGTPLPIQFFAFQELIGKHYDSEWIEFMYPRLKRYYDFMAGHNPDSRTVMPSGLIRTWDYFYNSGGWDDYPPQHYLRQNSRYYPSVAPMVSTSYYIRAAKILRLIATELGYKADVRQFDSDIASMSSAILDNAWDEECGYFGYVTHDEEGRPSGILRYEDGTDFNMGLDGVSPLVAGICSESQKERLTSHIISPGELWTDVGISTVDRRAPYYAVDGYWNGCVWMPHQLVLWKTMLDMGRADIAEKIAFTALDNWRRETGDSYQCYEHFIISTGRGGGWHNFSGLSSPVINWFNSYFKIGTVSTGFDIMLKNPEMNGNCDGYSAELCFDKDARGHMCTVILCLDPSKEYGATLNGRQLKVSSPRPGLVYVDVPADGHGRKFNVYSL